MRNRIAHTGPIGPRSRSVPGRPIGPRRSCPEVGLLLFPALTFRNVDLVRLDRHGAVRHPAAVLAIFDRQRGVQNHCAPACGARSRTLGAHPSLPFLIEVGLSLRLQKQKCPFGHFYNNHRPKICQTDFTRACFFKLLIASFREEKEEICMLRDFDNFRPSGMTARVIPNNSASCKRA